MRAINIMWDIDEDEDNVEVNLPEEIEIPDDLKDEDEISDYLSDLTGFCHNCFTLVR